MKTILVWLLPGLLVAFILSALVFISISLTSIAYTMFVCAVVTFGALVITSKWPKKEGKKGDSKK